MNATWSVDTSRAKSEASAHTRSRYTPLQWGIESCISRAMETTTSSPPRPGYLQGRRLERKRGSAPDTSTHRCRNSRCSSLSPSVSSRDGSSFYSDNGKRRQKSAPIRCRRRFLRITMCVACYATIAVERGVVEHGRGGFCHNPFLLHVITLISLWSSRKHHPL